MAALGITVLKNNVPWGPFSREQIEEGLLRGDFTVKYLAHAPGLKEWLPLGEVLHYLDAKEAPRPSLPPVPGPRELPPVPESGPAVPVAAPVPPPLRPPIRPGVNLSSERAFSPDAPVIEKQEVRPDPQPEVVLVPASFFLRGIAFLIDCTILFVPVGILFALGGLAIEVPGAISHIDHESRVQEWALLKRNTDDLIWIVAIGFGWLYGAGLECSRSQATVGKRWMGIKVTDANGERMSFLRATGRYAAKFVSALPCFMGFVAALFSSRGLALHDRLAGTRVVRG
jgi:uncharacterized RDD family membrane protein YckC